MPTASTQERGHTRLVGQPLQHTTLVTDHAHVVRVALGHAARFAGEHSTSGRLGINGIRLAARVSGLAVGAVHLDDRAAGSVQKAGELSAIRSGSLDALRVARRSALKMRTQTFQQMKALLVTAPVDLPKQLRTLSRDRLVHTAAGMRPRPVTSVAAAVKLALKGLAQRHQLLTTELATLDGDQDRLVRAVAPTLCALTGVGTDAAGAVLVAAGDNPERLRSEGAFANLCGAAPLRVSSG